jgi:hypothetical protein
MAFLRSEEHLTRWLGQNGWEAGATMPATTLNELAGRWWSSRLDPAWEPRSREDSQRILDGLGLVGPFWQLA